MEPEVLSHATSQEKGAKRGKKEGMVLIEAKSGEEKSNAKTKELTGTRN